MVRCADCGFLALRRRESQQLLGAEMPYREHGVLPEAVDADFQDEFESTPYCFVMAQPIHKEREDRKGIIQRDRSCDSWVQWQQGFSPKEHREMLEEQRRRQLEDEVRKSAYEREDRRDAEMRKREDERDERLHELQKRLHNRQLLIIGGFVTLALVVGSLGAAIIEGAVSRGWEPSWWPF